MTMTDELASATLTPDERAAYKAGYEAAIADGKVFLRDVYAPVPIRWRHVNVGDVFIGAKDKAWMVSDLAETGDGQILVVARQGANEFSAVVDPDEAINMLMLTTERDAIQLLRDELGAQLIERRAS